MRTKTGTASSTKAAKTVVITVHTYKRHPKYLKRYRSTKKFHAHDERDVCREGDTVTIAEHRPLSKLKRWTVIEVNGQPVDQVEIRAEVEETKLEDLDTPDELVVEKEAPEATEETPAEEAEESPAEETAEEAEATEND